VFREQLLECLHRGVPAYLHERSGGLIEALEMLEFYGAPLFEAASHLMRLETELERVLAEGNIQHRIFRVDPAGMENLFKPVFAAFRSNLETLHLWMTQKTLDKLEEGLAKGADIAQLRVLINELRSRFNDEVSAVCLLCVTYGKRHYYQQADALFGTGVFNNFPTAADDIAEAGKCFALERATACVFHLMRVTEVGLKAAARELEIPYAPSWESYIKQIRVKVEEDWSKKTPQWKARESFFKELLGDLQAMKLAWRNPTMHIVRKYDEEDALNILNATKAFMQRLAENGISDGEAVSS
jgi:hypothetical protein